MHELQIPAPPPSGSDTAPPQLDRLQDAIERAAALLPIPGPITAFAFLNTLQALEHLPFEEGMRKGAALYGCEPYLAEDRYREHIARGRIRLEDLATVLREDLAGEADTPVATFGTRFDLRLAMLKFSLPTGPAEELRWFVSEMDALAQFCEDVSPESRAKMIADTREWMSCESCRDDDPAIDQRSWLAREEIRSDLAARFAERAPGATAPPTPQEEALTLQALWRVCFSGVQNQEQMAPPYVAPVRLRDALREATGEDSDLLVHDELIRFCAAFTDQGFAGWPLPHRELGFYQSFCRLFCSAGGPATHWTQDLPEEVIRLDTSDITPLESIRESCAMLGVTEADWDDFIPATLLALRGWAGMIWQMEQRPDRVPLAVSPGTLIEYLAVRLILERLAISHLARRTLGYTGPLDRLRSVIVAPPTQTPATSIEQQAFVVFQLAQRLSWSPRALARLSQFQWSRLLGEIEAFSSLDRRRILHLAFERRFHARALDALSVHGGRKTSRVAEPSFQVVTCIDAREESFRRHLEEVEPNAETFAAAGFFGVPIYYRGVADAHFAALCPIVMKPNHWVVEDVVYTLGDTHRRRAKVRRALGTASHQFHVGSRSLAGGLFLTAGFGILASIPLMARVLFPRSTAQFRRMTSRIIQAPSITRLRLERSDPTPGPEEGQIGFTVEEMADFAERTLRDIGLTSGFARLVLFLGHGSFSLNNPHKSVYDCGACTGNAGSPNGRALAAMLNDLRVREILGRRGLRVPSETWFLGGLHNTCDDTVTFFDLELLPTSHFRYFESVQRVLEETCDRNAHERCRRFDSAPLELTFASAHRHVEVRSQDLAQARPEFGNATNALCVVGRRQRTRGLYLDRRSFLMSYDPLQDDESSSTLERILSAVVPVCEGINMQYFLSFVDSAGWGSGTKLPHNVTSLLGVMDGAASDLRSGLPWQGVEIHEPVRLLFVLETTPDAMRQIMARNETIGRILRNGWARLAVLSPGSAEIQIYRDGDFHLYQPAATTLPQATSSTAWYHGLRDHLEFAVIGADENTAIPHPSDAESCLTTNY